MNKENLKENRTCVDLIEMGRRDGDPELNMNQPVLLSLALLNIDIIIFLTIMFLLNVV